MKITIKQAASLSLLIAFLCIVAYSCKRDNNQTIKEAQQGVPDAVKNQIASLGYDTRNIRTVDGGYVVEGDIFLSHNSLNQKSTSPVLRVANSEQFQTTCLITGLPRTLTVSVTGLPSGYESATDIAIARYNALGLRISFVRVSSGGMIDIQYASLGAGALGQSAGFPDCSTGNPPSPIKLNSDANALGSSPDQNYLATVIAHEIGHTIGFRHTDYFNRAYSCGGFPYNEGQAGVGAINIPGTPTTADPNSWMLSCIGNGVNRPFNANDIIALRYLYQ
ncbi:M57 family metalloprotease [Chitinophaga flava]|uniref:Protease n=1 Tax=Chitinophaga flava TaxID=2259036 RepID=A0A365XVK8_9BACT|nr:M57 family metalloprotease [Chitinophaga flava]RBL90407.1 protease [Chitinophaga flava]